MTVLLGLVLGMTLLTLLLWLLWLLLWLLLLLLLLTLLTLLLLCWLLLLLEHVWIIIESGDHGRVLGETIGHYPRRF